MNPPRLLHELVASAAERTPRAIALVDAERRLDYAELRRQIECCAAGLVRLGLARGARLAVYLEKCSEAVVACFGASHAGAVFVPVNPLLKPAQVEHILQDCAVTLLVTSPERLALLAPILPACAALRWIVVVDGATGASAPAAAMPIDWQALLDSAPVQAAAVEQTTLAAIFYTSGSTGRAKGVMLSHRNLVVGAASVAGYLDNRHDDVLLAALPLSFDAGFSQLTTAFHAGARVVLINYLVPRDVLLALRREQVTGLTAVPPLYIQLAQLDWPAACADALRYFANTGGRMPQDTLQKLRQKAPRARPFLMYGLTEAFRSTYLAPEEAARRPDSIGKAIPGAEIFVLRPDGTPCAPDEPGELVHGGPLVSLGYWNNPAATAERFRPLPAPLAAGRAEPAAPAVFSGDTVRIDAAGFLYFVGRRDEMIKTSGYRVSPTEVEEALYASGLIGECIAFGVPHPLLGQAIQVIATPAAGSAASAEQLIAACRGRLPAYMVPAAVELRDEPLPRNANGKIDRKGLQGGRHGQSGG